MPARGGDGDTGLRHLVFQRIEPNCVRASFAQQSHALTHRFFVAIDAAAVGGIEAVNQPVEQFAPVSGAFSQNAVHIGRNPRHRHMFGQRVLAARVFAVDMYKAAFIIGFLLRIAAGANMQRTEFGTQFGSDSPRIACAVFLQIGKCSASQASSWDQKTDRLCKIGFAAAVGAGEHDRFGRAGKIISKSS